MNLKTVLKLELKNFFASRTVTLAFLCVAFAAAYAVYHGGNIIEKQRQVIAELPSLQAEHTEKLLGYKQGAELADALYYLTFNTVHEPSSWAPLAVGQRDVNPYNVKVRMLALEGQIYDSELTNPTNLLFGNFDLSFVIVFLFPLVIIAFTHNLLSSEQEAGTWSLLRSQPISPLKILSLRLVLQFAIVTLSALALMLFGNLFLQVELDKRFFCAALLIVAYLAFWFGAALLVISFNRSSNFNALALLGLWIVLCLLAPALLSTVMAIVYPVSESLETIVRQREGYHEKWDRPKRETMQRFYQKYPQFALVPIPEDQFSWGWYYAMQQMGDEDSANATASYRQKLEQRNNFTRRAAWFLPTVAAQLEFNKIAESDLDSHLAYLDSVRNYHASIREFFYPHIFRDAKVSEIDVRSLPVLNFKNDCATSLFSNYLFTILSAASLLIGAACVNFQKKIRNI